MTILRDLPTSDNHFLVWDNASELSSILNDTAFPLAYRESITGIYAEVGNGEYINIWYTESSAPYSLRSEYHTIEYYNPVYQHKTQCADYCEGEALPVWILDYSIPSRGLYFALWYCEGGVYQIKDCEGAVIADNIPSWDDAVIRWEAVTGKV